MCLLLSLAVASDCCQCHGESSCYRSMSIDWCVVVRIKIVCQSTYFKQFTPPNILGSSVSLCCALCCLPFTSSYVSPLSLPARLEDMIPTKYRLIYCLTSWLICVEEPSFSLPTVMISFSLSFHLYDHLPLQNHLYFSPCLFLSISHLHKHPLSPSSWSVTDCLLLAGGSQSATQSLGSWRTWTLDR